MIAQRLADDPAYRNSLMADPRTAVSEVIGLAIPDSVHVILHEESSREVHLSIPPLDELTDEDLELIGGGAGFDLGHGAYNPWSCGYGAQSSCP